MIFSGTIANVLHFKIDQAMIAYWLGTTEVGIYTVSVRWAEMLFVLDNAILSAALFKIASSSTAAGYELTRQNFKTQMIISGGSGLILALLAYPLILFLYGPPFKEAILPLIILIPGIVAWSTSKAISNLLTYNLGMGGFLAKLSYLGCFMNIILNVFLIKFLSLGILGAAMASSLSYIFVSLVIMIKARIMENLYVPDQTSN